MGKDSNPVVHPDKVSGITSTTSTVAAAEKMIVGWRRRIDTTVPGGAVAERVSTEASPSCGSIA